MNQLSHHDSVSSVIRTALQRGLGISFIIRKAGEKRQTVIHLHVTFSKTIKILLLYRLRFKIIILSERSEVKGMKKVIKYFFAHL